MTDRDLPLTPALIGQRVRVQRDETRHPAAGTWRKYRGRTGTVVQVNGRDREIGVVLGAPRAGMLMRRPDGRGFTGFAGDEVTWFAPHELRILGDTPESPHSDETGNGGATRLYTCSCGSTLTTVPNERLACCQAVR